MFFKLFEHIHVINELHEICTIWRCISGLLEIEFGALQAPSDFGCMVHFVGRQFPIIGKQCGKECCNVQAQFELGPMGKAFK